ncbi:uncharacterized protein LOC110281588 [Arachis duranensis]|uniref:Uncharacterized protein LOC110281588 n=1 Tax=Arachis duranensis TaxID=130453 RepID=A0A6P5NTP9_ARADU|nr:uncharacterized protein LOC110281588 [Arachis duranensis]
MAIFLGGTGIRGDLPTAEQPLAATLQPSLLASAATHTRFPFIKEGKAEKQRGKTGNGTADLRREEGRCRRASLPSCCTREDERVRNGHGRERVTPPRSSRRNAGEGEADVLPKTASAAVFVGLGLLRSLLAVKPVAIAPSAISLPVLLSVKSIALLMLLNQAEEEGDSVVLSPRRTATREEPGCRCLSRRRGESPEEREGSCNVEGGRCGPVARAGTRPTAQSYRRRFHRRRTSLPSPENLTNVAGEPRCRCRRTLSLTHRSF